ESLVGTPAFQVRMAPECCGYEGIGLIWIFLGAYLWLYRRHLRFPRALLLLPAGAALIWLANAVRITALIALGTWASPAVARGGFHSQAGWLAFNAVGLGLVAVSHRVGFWARPGARPAAGADATAAYLMPFLALVLVGMLAKAFSEAPERLYPFR